jgi:acetyl-CoA carboxylase carboxyl transferase subunit alpha
LATVQLSRHPNRPYTLNITNLTKTFLELLVIEILDDKAMIGGLGQIDGQSFMIVVNKRINTKMRQ